MAKFCRVNVYWEDADREVLPVAFTTTVAVALCKDGPLLFERTGPMLARH